MNENLGLKRTLTPLMLWGLGVGYVISGMYFGWNIGLDKGGTLGLGIATFFILVMYITFSLSYSELACAIPKAGGGFDYSDNAQTAVDEAAHITVAAEVVNTSLDVQQLPTVLAAVKAHTESVIALGREGKEQARPTPVSKKSGPTVRPHSCPKCSGAQPRAQRKGRH